MLLIPKPTTIPDTSAPKSDSANGAQYRNAFEYTHQFFLPTKIKASLRTVNHMSCMRCSSENQYRVRQLAIMLSPAVRNRQGVGVNAILCHDCGFLELTVPNPA